MSTIGLPVERNRILSCRPSRNVGPCAPFLDARGLFEDIRNTYPRTAEGQLSVTDTRIGYETSRQAAHVGRLLTAGMIEPIVSRASAAL